MEGMITQLVFEHALRIRMKEETASTGTTPAPSATPSANPSEPGSPEASEFGEGSVTVVGSEASGSQGTLTNGGAPNKGKGKAKQASEQSPAPATKEPEKKEEDKGGANNLLGKINNLITSDLDNIANGRVFLFLRETYFALLYRNLSR